MLIGSPHNPGVARIEAELYGLVESHVVELDASCCLGVCMMHPLAAVAFADLRDRAARAGLDLKVVSGFRSFARQLRIWNDKARGVRPVLDQTESPIDLARLADRDKVFAILCWSALPGTSRHHWGSDADVYDAAALNPGESPALTVRASGSGGVFAELHRWLDERISANDANGFFRPYTGSGTSYQKEPWHLSYAPLAARFQGMFDLQTLRTILAGHELELHEAVQRCLPGIVSDYVQVPAYLYPMPWGLRLAMQSAPRISVSSGPMR